MFHDSVLTTALDYAGVAVFAATGALAAARRGYDIVTFAFFAAITGIGGGTLRDLLIGAPVFWVGQPAYVGVSVAAAGMVWALGERLSRIRTLLWLDALGIAAYCVVGASKAAEWGAPPLVSVAMGVLTATFGGMLRDVLAGEPSALLRKEIYVTATVGGAGLFVLVKLVGLSDGAAATVGVVTAFALRAGALARGWSLPGYQGRSETIAVPAVPVVAASAIAEPEPTATPAPIEAAPKRDRRTPSPKAAPVTPDAVELTPTRPRRPRRPKSETPA